MFITTFAACAPSKPSDKESDTSNPPAAETPATETETESPADEAPATSETPEQKPAETQAEQPAAEVEAASDPNQVLLGSAELTSGIPGEGDLSQEQIEAWLSDDANHAVLTVELQQGLAAGASAINIPADNPLTRAKIELGRQLYFDKRLSSDSTISCADCHHPDEGYARHTQFGEGVGGQTGNRNSPVSYNRILSGAQFWDGRADSLEAQAVGPIANPIEMANTHDACIECLKGIEGYRIQFEKIFDDGVTIDNVGRAIASFERVIVTGPSAYDLWEPVRSIENALGDDLDDLDTVKEEDPALYDKYMKALAASETKPMSDSAKRGREIFFSKKGGCTACHTGANFTDEKYHNLGVGMEADEPDLGRFAVTEKDEDRGAFKTPTVRNVALSAPYMHDGSQKTLAEVVDWYNKGGHPNPHLSKDVRKLELSDEEKADLVEFMKALTGDFPQVESGRLPM
ncbi:MAG: c-type cytochrome [Planctomycetales bacterium]|nr:c-type cytochrome [Planctomycetales bacterium]